MRIIHCVRTILNPVSLMLFLVASVLLNLYLLLTTKKELAFFSKRSVEPSVSNKLTITTDEQQYGVLQTNPTMNILVLPDTHLQQQTNANNSCKSYASDHSSSHHILAVMIVTAPANFKQRNTIRRTWKNGYKNRTHYVKFVIGTKNLPRDTINTLEKENSENQDLLLLHELTDGYKNLTHKVLAGMIWFDRNVNYSYLMKCDDDTFILLDTIEDELGQRKSSTGLYWGNIQWGVLPMLEGKWAETNWNISDTYFPYAMGGAYILSSDLIRRVVLNADVLVLYNNEDVSVSSWIVSFVVERKHDPRFCFVTWMSECTCLVTTLDNVDEKLEDMNERYIKSGELCSIKIYRKLWAGHGEGFIWRCFLCACAVCVYMLCVCVCTRTSKP